MTAPRLSGTSLLHLSHTRMAFVPRISSCLTGKDAAETRGNAAKKTVRAFLVKTRFVVSPRADDRDPRGRPDRARALEEGSPCARRDVPGSSSSRPLRPFARGTSRDTERSRSRGGCGDPRARFRPEGRDGDAREGGRRRVAEPDPPRGDRWQGHRPHRPPHPWGCSVRRRARADLRRPHGRRRRVRREGVA